jgi:hypothetical protein
MLPETQRLEGELKKSSPYVRSEYVTVTFPSTLGQDIDIAHTLDPDDPDAVDYEVVGRASTTLAGAAITQGFVYHDTSGTRRAWGSNYITLRCSQASNILTLRLSVRRT